MSKIMAVSGGGSGGYDAYKNVLYTQSSEATSHTITGVNIGDKLLVLLLHCSSSIVNRTALDDARAANDSATLTFLGNLTTTNTYVCGTYFNCVCNATSVTISDTTAHRLIAIKAE